MTIPVHIAIHGIDLGMTPQKASLLLSAIGFSSIAGRLIVGISVDNFGAGDLIETIYKENNIYIPLNDENVLSVNIENKKIIVNPIKGIINYD